MYIVFLKIVKYALQISSTLKPLLMIKRRETCSKFKILKDELFG